MQCDEVMMASQSAPQLLSVPAEILPVHVHPVLSAASVALQQLQSPPIFQGSASVSVHQLSIISLDMRFVFTFNYRRFHARKVARTK